MAEQIPPRRVAELAETGEAQLVDVRTEAEWAAGRIPGARHVPVDRLPSEAGSLDPDRPVVFYCRVGERSAVAADALAAAGRESYSMEGGLTAWAAEDRPLEPEGGEVAPHSQLPPA